MEGVLVSAQRASTPTTVTVVSDRQGHYSFPRNRLQPGSYRATIRADGYDADDPGTVEITVNKTAQFNLKLHQTQGLASQLSNAEWTLSIPEANRPDSIARCVECHTLLRVVQSRHDAEAWLDVLYRIQNYAETSAAFNTVRVNMPYEAPRTAVDQNLAAYLSTINLSSVDKWRYRLKTLPRPAGEARKVITTEYDLPRKGSQPHDALAESIVVRITV